MTRQITADTRFLRALAIAFYVIGAMMLLWTLFAATHNPLAALIGIFVPTIALFAFAALLQAVTSNTESLAHIGNRLSDRDVKLN